MIGRSIPSWSMTTRVATRFGSELGRDARRSASRRSVAGSGRTKRRRRQGAAAGGAGDGIAVAGLAWTPAAVVEQAGGEEGHAGGGQERPERAGYGGCGRGSASGRHPTSGLDRMRPGPRPCTGRDRQPQFTGCGVGWAASWSAGRVIRGSARSWVLPGVPFGPSEVWSQSCSVVAWTASSRVSWWRRTSRDLVLEEQVVARVDLDDHPDHRLRAAALLLDRPLVDRPEHPVAGMGVQVGRLAADPAGRAPGCTSRRCTAGRSTTIPRA